MVTFIGSNIVKSTMMQALRQVWETAVHAREAFR